MVTIELTAEQQHDLDHAKTVAPSVAFCVGLSIAAEVGLVGEATWAFAEAQEAEASNGQL
jgi:hypothetical protein